MRTVLLRPEPIGQLQTLSDGDILKIRLLYQCQSGPRALSDYRANPCTEDCLRWETAKGCGNDDKACQGNLICDDANHCVISALAKSSRRLIRSSGASVCILYLLLYFDVCHHRRGDYELLP